MIQHFNYPNVKSIVVCGDIHGEFESLVIDVCVRRGMRDTLVIVAGDCGFGFRYIGYYNQLYLHWLRKRLEAANVYMVFVRGNHDNPALFNSEKISWMRFFAVPDYSVVSACGHQVLCVGGAVSIDRGSRTEGKDWWMNEGPSLRPDLMADIAKRGFRIDSVVTHVAPSFCENVTPPQFVQAYIESDPTLLSDMRHERDVMDGLLANLHHDGHPLRHWYYGHYHHSWNAEIDGVDFTMLDIMELKEVR